MEIAERAYDNGNGVFLFYDAYSVEVQSDGLAKVWLIDLGIKSHYLPQTSRDVKQFSNLTLNQAIIYAERFIEDYLE